MQMNHYKWKSHYPVFVLEMEEVMIEQLRTMGLLKPPAVL